MPLELSAAAAAGAGVQLRLIADDGYAGPDETASRMKLLPSRLFRRKTAATSRSGDKSRCSSHACQDLPMFARTAPLNLVLRYPTRGSLRVRRKV